VVVHRERRRRRRRKRNMILKKNSELPAGIPCLLLAQPTLQTRKNG
jgi:hypothetical protein